MQLFVGTSSFGFKEWKGSFYPPKLPQKELMGYYAEHFGAVEVNHSFRQMPKASVLEDWAERVPVGFQFAFKAPQTITQFKRLKNAEVPTQKFLQETAILKKRRGPLLFGLHPTHRKDIAVLRDFLKQLPTGVRTAFEFRHVSWFDDETFDCLRRNRIALCTNDDEQESPWTELVRTTDWGYVRLRRESYTDRALAGWVKKLKAQKWKAAYVFFKHEDKGTGPKLATRFLKLANT